MTSGLVGCPPTPADSRGEISQKFENSKLLLFVCAKLILLSSVPRLVTKDEMSGHGRTKAPPKGWLVCDIDDHGHHGAVFIQPRSVASSTHIFF